MKHFLEVESEQLTLLRNHLPDPAASFEKALKGFFEQNVSEPILQSSAALEGFAREFHAANSEESSDTSESFFKLIRKLESDGQLPPEIASSFHYVRILGNKVRHDAAQIRIQPFDTETCLRLTYRALYWYLTEYEDGPECSPGAWPLSPSAEKENSRSYNNLLSLTIRLMEKNPINRSVLEVLVNDGSRTVDGLVNDLNLSRMSILNSTSTLMEHDIVGWKQPGSDQLVLNNEPFNMHYVVNQALEKQ